MSGVEAKNQPQENPATKELEAKAANMSDKEKMDVANKMSDLDGKYTSVLEGIVSRYQKGTEEKADNFDIKQTIFEFKKQEQGGREGANQGDGQQLLDILKSELPKMEKNLSLGIATKDIVNMKITGMQKNILGSSQIYVVVETKNGNQEKRFLNSLPGIGADNNQHYLNRRDLYGKNGQLDITAAFNNDADKNFAFEANTDKTVFQKYNPNNPNERVEEKPYQFYTEVALQSKYTKSFETIASQLGISIKENNGTISLQDKDGNIVDFRSNGDTFKMRQKGKGPDFAKEITREQYYICQATLYRVAEKLPPYTGTTKDLEGEYKFSPLYKNR